MHISRTYTPTRIGRNQNIWQIVFIWMDLFWYNQDGLQVSKLFAQHSRESKR